MGIIKVTNIRVYAHHGCISEETVIGSDYRVDIEVNADLTKSCESDELNDTVDYVLLNRIVKEEMAMPKKLLETVAKNIINRIFKEAQQVDYTKVAVSKINPPIGGDVEQVTIELEEIRKL